MSISKRVFLCALLHFSFRLLEIRFRNNGRYPLEVLLAILSPVLIKDKYTWPSDCNRSRKDPLPNPLYNAIMKVARIRLKNTPMSIAEFVEKIRHKFSSLKTKEYKVRIYNPLFSDAYIYIYIYIFLFFNRARRNPQST